MDLWYPPEDEAPLLEWWTPLLLAASAARRERIPWPIHLDDFMLMGRVDRDSRPAVWIYKHRDSRRELNLDSTGQAYKFTRTPNAASLRALHGVPTSAGDLPGRPADVRRARLVRRASPCLPCRRGRAPTSRADPADEPRLRRPRRPRAIPPVAAARAPAPAAATSPSSGVAARRAD